MLQEAAELLSNPEVFIRKWIGEAFCGVLQLNACLFVLDTCFLLGFDTWVASCYF